MFEIDTGSSGSGSSRPVVKLAQQGKQRGTYKRCSWSIRDSDGRKVFKGF